MCKGLEAPAPRNYGKMAKGGLPQLWKPFEWFYFVYIQHVRTNWPFQWTPTAFWYSTKKQYSLSLNSLNHLPKLHQSLEVTSKVDFIWRHCKCTHRNTSELEICIFPIWTLQEIHPFWLNATKSASHRSGQLYNDFTWQRKPWNHRISRSFNGTWWRKNPQIVSLTSWFLGSLNP